jgi:TatA/E family protein of Tat protein translocase
MILIFVVALLLFGPRQMPQIGRSIGRALGEFRRASNEFKRTIEDEVAVEEIRSVEQDLRAASEDAIGIVKKAAEELEGPEEAQPPMSVTETETTQGEEDKE